MILIAYDGTSCSDHAIAIAGSLLRGGRAHVLHVWQPLAADAYAMAGAIPPAGAVADGEIDREEAQAQAVAEAGVALARAAGFDADGEAIEAGSPSLALEDAVDRLKPDVIVVGSRGLTGLKALLKGSVSHHVGAHAHAPVLIVPHAE